ncbi:hypothetical protein GGG16DRAFT_103710 [Schizophyllum commune]
MHPIVPLGPYPKNTRSVIKVLVNGWRRVFSLHDQKIFSLRGGRVMSVFQPLKAWKHDRTSALGTYYMTLATTTRSRSRMMKSLCRALGPLERMLSLPTDKPFASSDSKGSGLRLAAKCFSAFNVRNFTSEFSSKAYDFTSKVRQYTLPRPMPRTSSCSGSSSSESESTRFGSSLDGEDPPPTPTTKEFTFPIPIHLSGMQTLASFDSNKGLPSPPAYDVEAQYHGGAQYGPYNVDNRVSYHIADRASYPTGVAYSSDSEHRRINPHATFTSANNDLTDEPTSPALPDTPSSCSSSATFSTLQSRDFIVLPSTTDVTRDTGSLPIRRSPAGPPRLPSLSQLFGISSMTRERDVEAQVEDVATGTATAPAPASTTIAPATTTTAPTTTATIQRGEPDVPTSPRTHRASV